MINIDQLCRTVQHNCDVSDARHAGDYPMCIYLLRMREYYRWRQGIELDRPLSLDAVGDWVDEIEHTWHGLEQASLQPLTIDGHHLDPFDQDNINRLLVPFGYVYSAGYGRVGKPVFVLSRLLECERTENYTLYITGQELARELSAPPAMLREHTIIVRRESLRRVIWEMIDEWRWQKRQNAVARLLDSYDWNGESLPALDRIADHEVDTLVMHEIGELVCTGMLGGNWDTMIMEIEQPALEAVLRSMRDFLADCLSTLPSILSQADDRSLHFYFAGLTPLRRKLFPALENAYQHWVREGDVKPLRSTVCRGQAHWLDAARQMMNAGWRGHDNLAAEKVVERYRL